jgi:hypothetical protein
MHAQYSAYKKDELLDYNLLNDFKQEMKKSSNKPFALRENDSFAGLDEDSSFTLHDDIFENNQNIEDSFLIKEQLKREYQQRESLSSKIERKNREALQISEFMKFEQEKENNLLTQNQEIVISPQRKKPRLKKSLKNNAKMSEIPRSKSVHNRKCSNLRLRNSGGGENRYLFKIETSKALHILDRSRPSFPGQISHPYLKSRKGSRDITTNTNPHSHSHTQTLPLEAPLPAQTLEQYLKHNPSYSQKSTSVLPFNPNASNRTKTSHTQRETCKLYRDSASNSALSNSKRIFMQRHSENPHSNTVALALKRPVPVPVPFTSKYRAYVSKAYQRTDYSPEHLVNPKGKGASASASYRAARNQNNCRNQNKPLFSQRWGKTHANSLKDRSQRGMSAGGRRPPHPNLFNLQQSHPRQQRNNNDLNSVSSNTQPQIQHSLASAHNPFDNHTQTSKMLLDLDL